MKGKKSLQGIGRASAVFAEKILSNYSWGPGTPGEEDLLHLLTQPPAFFLEDGEVSAVWNQKLSVFCQLLNRLLLSVYEKNTWQDMMYLDRMLVKLGIRNSAEFLQQLRETVGAEKRTERLSYVYRELLKDKKLAQEGEGVGREPDKEISLWKRVYDRLHLIKLCGKAGDRICMAYAARGSVGPWELLTAEFIRASEFARLTLLKDTLSGHEQRRPLLHPNGYEMAGKEASLPAAALLSLINELNTAVFTVMGESFSKPEWISIEPDFYGTAYSAIKRFTFCQRERRELTGSLRNYEKTVSRLLKEEYNEIVKLLPPYQLQADALSAENKPKEWKKLKAFFSHINQTREKELLKNENDYFLEVFRAEKEPKVPKKLFEIERAGAEQREGGQAEGPRELKVEFQTEGEKAAGGQESFGRPEIEHNAYEREKDGSEEREAVRGEEKAAGGPGSFSRPEIEHKAYEREKDGSEEREAVRGEEKAAGGPGSFGRPEIEHKAYEREKDGSEEREAVRGEEKAAGGPGSFGRPEIEHKSYEREGNVPEEKEATREEEKGNGQPGSFDGPEIEYKSYERKGNVPEEKEATRGEEKGNGQPGSFGGPEIEYRSYEREGNVPGERETTRGEEKGRGGQEGLHRPEIKHKVYEREGNVPEKKEATRGEEKGNGQPGSFGGPEIEYRSYEREGDVPEEREATRREEKAGKEPGRFSRPEIDYKIYEGESNGPGERETTHREEKIGEEPGRFSRPEIEHKSYEREGDVPEEREATRREEKAGKEQGRFGRPEIEHKTYEGEGSSFGERVANRREERASEEADSEGQPQGLALELRIKRAYEQTEALQGGDEENPGNLPEDRYQEKSYRTEGAEAEKNIIPAASSTRSMGGISETVPEHYRKQALYHLRKGGPESHASFMKEKTTAKIAGLNRQQEKGKERYGRKRKRAVERANLQYKIENREKSFKNRKRKAAIPAAGREGRKDTPAQLKKAYMAFEEQQSRDERKGAPVYDAIQVLIKRQRALQDEEIKRLFWENDTDIEPSGGISYPTENPLWQKAAEEADARTAGPPELQGQIVEYGVASDGGTDQEGRTLKETLDRWEAIIAEKHRLMWEKATEAAGPLEGMEKSPLIVDRERTLKNQSLQIKSQKPLIKGAAVRNAERNADPAEEKREAWIEKLNQPARQLYREIASFGVSPAKEKEGAVKIRRASPGTVIQLLNQASAGSVSRPVEEKKEGYPGPVTIPLVYKQTASWPEPPGAGQKKEIMERVEWNQVQREKKTEIHAGEITQGPWRDTVTRLVEKTMNGRLDTVTDQVYKRLEKKLKSERIRRGLT